MNGDLDFSSGPLGFPRPSSGRPQSAFSAPCPLAAVRSFLQCDCVMGEELSAIDESGEELPFHIPPSLYALCFKGSRAASLGFPLGRWHNSSIHFKNLHLKKNLYILYRQPWVFLTHVCLLYMLPVSTALWYPVTTYAFCPPHPVLGVSVGIVS